MLAPEYPGYSFYKNQSASEKRVNQEMEIVVRYVQRGLGFSSDKIVVVGRSLGCSFTLNLCRTHRFNAVVLVSPFFDIRSAVGEVVGSFAKVLVKDGFPNNKHIRHLESPLLIIHGQDDSLISVRNA